MGLYSSRCVIPGNLLNDGRYRIEVLFVRDQRHGIFKMRDAASFIVNESELRSQLSNYFGRWPGAVRPILPWATERIDISEADKVSQP